MLNIKVFLLAVLLLATEALAININYTAKYNGKDLKGNAATQTEKKAGGSLTDEQGQEVIEKMGEWSNNKFKATKSRVANIITVVNTSNAKDKNDATSEVNEAQQLVNKNIKKTKREVEFMA
jgi:cell fate regulator YaaT (PSP1 superfamily)